MDSDCSRAARVDAILDHHCRNGEELIAILLDCQEEFTHLPREVIEQVADGTGAPIATVLQIATFYRRFSMKPIGRYPVRVCMGTTCHVQGGPSLLDAFSRELGVQRGATTADLLFGVDTVNCLGCCGLAPVFIINGKFYGNMTQEQVPKVLGKYE